MFRAIGCVPASSAFTFSGAGCEIPISSIFNKVGGKEGGKGKTEGNYDTKRVYF